jgi:hypothetical protein
MSFKLGELAGASLNKYIGGDMSELPKIERVTLSVHHTHDGVQHWGVGLYLADTTDAPKRVFLRATPLPLKPRHDAHAMLLFDVGAVLRLKKLTNGTVVGHSHFGVEQTKLRVPERPFTGLVPELVPGTLKGRAVLFLCYDPETAHQRYPLVRMHRRRNKSAAPPVHPELPLPAPHTIPPGLLPVVGHGADSGHDLATELRAAIELVNEIKRRERDTVKLRIDDAGELRARLITVQEL